MKHSQIKTVTLIWLIILTYACTPNIPNAKSPEAQLYLETCTKCHSWPHPARHTAREWDHHVGVMEDHMKKHGILFPKRNKAIILKYLYRYAR